MLDTELAAAHQRYKKRLAYLEEIETRPTMDPVLAERARAQSPEIGLQRYKEAASLAALGWTRRRIASAMGVSQSRIGQMLKHKTTGQLSVRAQNALASMGYCQSSTYSLDPDINPADIAKNVSKRALRKIPNCGNVTAVEIALWLEKQGYSMQD